MTTAPPDGVQMDENDRVWARGDFVREYAGRSLRPVEVHLLVRCRDELAGRRILELGCGGGRITGYLAALGRATHGTDISPRMVEHCRAAYPEATFEVRSLTDLDAFGDGSYDVVVAGFNLIDVLDDPARREVLRELRRILAPGGLLIMSSHNRAFLPHVPTPVRAVVPGSRARLPARIARLPLQIRNRRRLLAHQRFEREYAIVADPALDFRLLLYYIDRDAQERQLDECGLALEGCFDLDGAEVAAGDDAATCPELHYVARRPAGDAA